MSDTNASEYTIQLRSHLISKLRSLTRLAYHHDSNPPAAVTPRGVGQPGRLPQTMA
jgi:hypothetical protein